MDLRESAGVTMAGPAFAVTFVLAVENARALWNAAAERALAVPGMTLEDVLETIGPREDPSIADCIALLAEPLPLAGCALDSFDVREMAPPAGAQVVQLPLARAAAGRH